MLGTFSPQKEAYVIELQEETTPSGFLARGNYNARTKVYFSSKSMLNTSLKEEDSVQRKPMNN
jgi:RHO protein GDP dissociation inhibitor